MLDATDTLLTLMRDALTCLQRTWFNGFRMTEAEGEKYPNLAVSASAPRANSTSKRAKKNLHVGGRDERVRAVSSRAASEEQQPTERAWLDDVEHISDSEPED